MIPVRDDAARLIRCLESLASLNCDRAAIEIIIADNGSTDESREVARKAGARVLDLPGLSVAQVRNRAAMAAQGELLAFVDADHVIVPGWLRAGLDAISSPDAAAVGAPYSPPAESTWVQRAYDRFRKRPATRTDTEWLGSGNLLVRRDMFLRVGGFSESLETCEDVDLCKKLRRGGGRIVADPGMKSIHLGDPPTIQSLFLGELWRGRNNIRVTLRKPVTLRSLPSAFIPSVNLLFVATALCAAALVPFWPDAPLIFGTAAAGFLSFGILRAVRMAHGDRFQFFGENLVISFVYELARALALVSRATHKTRRGGQASADSASLMSRRIVE